MEKEELNSYIQHRAPTTSSSGGIIIHYMCHRSGFYNHHSSRERAIKGLGSKKMNGFCPAALDVKMKKDGPVKVKFHKTHFGHEVGLKEIGHMFLSKTDRKLIAGKIFMLFT